MCECKFLSCHFMSRTPFRMNKCLNVKKLLGRSRHDILSLQQAVSDCNVIRTHNHLVRKRTLDHLPFRSVWLND